MFRLLLFLVTSYIWGKTLNYLLTSSVDNVIFVKKEYAVHSFIDF